VLGKHAGGRAGSAGSCILDEEAEAVDEEAGDGMGQLAAYAKPGLTRAERFAWLVAAGVRLGRLSELAAAGAAEDGAEAAARVAPAADVGTRLMPFPGMSISSLEPPLSMVRPPPTGLELRV
jgi:hypothetical protein